MLEDIVKDTHESLNLNKINDKGRNKISPQKTIS